MRSSRVADITVAILAGSAAEAASAIASVEASAGHAGAQPEILLVFTAGPEPSGSSGRARALRVFPVGPAYAKQRALDAASCPLVAFLDASAAVARDWLAAVAGCFADPAVAAAGGPVRAREPARAGLEAVLLRRCLNSGTPTGNLALRREDAVAARGFDLRWDAGPVPGAEDLWLVATLRRRGGRVRWCPGMMARAAASAPKQRSLDVRRPLRAIAAARPGARRSPLAPLDALPAAVAAHVTDPIAPLRASPRPKTHLMYDPGGERLLHLYLNPSSRLRRSLDEREAIRTRTGLAGVPRLYAAVEQSDAVWVIEDRLRGVRPHPRQAPAWFATVADWAVRLAGPPGPPLRASAAWREFSAACLAAAPAHERSLRLALRVVDAMPSRHMHGDFQRRNVLLDGAAVGLVDWEGAWMCGVPGLDLVFLALLAESDRPDRSLLEGLLEGRDPHFGPLLENLARVGVAGATLRPAITAMAATWALGEERRLRRSGRPSGPRPWRDLLDLVA